MIKKLKWNAFEGIGNDKYEKERASYIAKYEEHIPGSSGLLHYKAWYYKKNPILGEAKWNELYPEGYNDWASSRKHITTQGIQNLVNKVDEIITVVNKLVKESK